MELTRPNVFDKPGRWYKLAMHVHTTNSDGRREPDWVLDFYKRAGYDAICFGDHGFVTTPVDPDGKMLVIPGCEIGTSQIGPGGATCYPHVMCVGADVAPEKPAGKQLTAQQLLALGKSGSEYAFICHPYWSILPDELLGSIEGLGVIEVYNHFCEVDNALGFSEYPWDMLLNRGLRIDAVAVDDTHWEEWCAEDTFARGYVMVKAAALTREAIITALKAGDHYSAMAPTIEAVRFDDDGVTVTTSPVRDIAFRTHAFRGRMCSAARGQTITEARLDIDPAIMRFVRVEITDREGRKAWTNPFYFAQA